MSLVQDPRYINTLALFISASSNIMTCTTWAYYAQPRFQRFGKPLRWATQRVLWALNDPPPSVLLPPSALQVGCTATLSPQLNAEHAGSRAPCLHHHQRRRLLPCASWHQPKTPSASAPFRGVPAKRRMSTFSGRHIRNALLPRRHMRAHASMPP